MATAVAICTISKSPLTGPSHLSLAASGVPPSQRPSTLVTTSNATKSASSPPSSATAPDRRSTNDGGSSRAVSPGSLIGSLPPATAAAPSGRALPLLSCLVVLRHQGLGLLGQLVAVEPLVLDLGDP